MEAEVTTGISKILSWQEEISARIDCKSIYIYVCMCVSGAVLSRFVRDIGIVDTLPPIFLDCLQVRTSLCVSEASFSIMSEKQSSKRAKTKSTVKNSVCS